MLLTDQSQRRIKLWSCELLNFPKTRLSGPNLVDVTIAFLLEENYQNY
jgi:hypothetical protein